MRFTDVRCLRVLVVSLILLFIPSLVLAQSSGTGSITGVVTDPSGAVVPNVTVTVTSLGTGQVRTATTGANGGYQVTLLPPGNYSVKFEAPGFQSTTNPTVTVTVTETGTLNAQLQVGAQTQQVTVEANVETVQTTSSTLGTVMGSQTVTELPLNTRNYTNLIALTSGANASVNNATVMGKGYQAVATNGAGVSQNNFQMDGTEINNYMGNGSAQELGSYGGLEVPPPDAIQEFKIQTSSYDASYGRNAGANVNVVTKSGTNAFHGTAFEFFRNTSLNANDFFIKNSEVTHLNAAGASSPLPNKEGTLNQNQYGGVFGGPIKKDKLFFFVSYQETWQKNGLADSAGASYGVVLPPLGPVGLNRGNCAVAATTLAGCNDGGLSAAFASIVGANMCPANNVPTTYLTNPNGFTGPNGFTNDIANTSSTATPSLLVANTAQLACNGSNISLVALRLLQLPNGINGQYYVPTSGLTPSSANNYGYAGVTTNQFPAYFKEHQGIGNWDYVINSKNTLSGRYYYGADPSTSHLVDAIFFGPFLDGPSVHTVYGDQGATLRLTSTITNNLVNEARFTYRRNYVNEGNDTTFTAAQVGQQGIGNSAYPQLPVLEVGGAGSGFWFGTHNFTISNENDNEFFVSDQVSWTHGRHTIRTGFEWEHELYFWNYGGFAIGGTTYTRVADFLVGLPGGCGPATATCNGTGQVGLSGNPVSNVASILSGSDRFQAAAGALIHYYTSHAVNGFIQDDLKVSSRLTLNLGLRWEYNPLVSDKNGMTSDVWGSLAVGVIPGTGCNYNGATYGVNATGGAGSGCSFVGFVAPSNYNAAYLGPIPAGVYVNNRPFPNQNTPPWDNFGPRAGFAYQPFKSNSKLVVRGGAGYFYDRLTGGFMIPNQQQVPPYAVTLVNSGSTIQNSTLAAPFPPVANRAGGWDPRWVNFNTVTSQPFVNGPGQSSNMNFQSFNQTYLTPLTYQYNLNLQYEFLPRWVVEVGYVGSHGIHQPVNVNQNGAMLAGTGAGQGLNCGYDGNPAHCVTANTTSLAAVSPTSGMTFLRVPALGFSPQLTQGSTLGSFKYNSFQATVRSQLSHGLTFQAAYTWSRAFVGTQIGNPNASLTYNVPTILTYGLNPNYHPQRLVINYTYLLPTGGHNSGVAGKILTGWSVSGVTTLQNGVPLNLTDNRGGSIYGSPITSDAQFAVGMTAANVPTPGGVESRLGGFGAANKYFNTAAFTSPLAATVAAPTAAGCAPGVNTCVGNTFGAAGIGFILGPGQNNWDISLGKITTVGGIREGATLQFRAEFFNTFNHTQFLAPAGAQLNVNGGASFGAITQASVNPRLIQLALKYSF